MLSRWADAICSVLERGDELVLVTAPALTGERMIVHGDETSAGTFGGGAVEAEGQKRAGEVFRSGISQLFTCSVPVQEPALSVVPDEKRVEVFLELIDATAVNLEIFRTLREGPRGRENCLAVVELGTSAREMRRVNRFLVKGDGSLLGEFDGSDELIASLQAAARSDVPVLTSVARRRFLVERC